MIATKKTNGRFSRFSEQDANDLATNLAKSLSHQFSFRESKALEKRVAASPETTTKKLRSGSKLFQMRTILSSAKRDKSFRVNLQATELAVKLFSRMFSRKLWRENIVYSRRAWLNGFPVNYDQQDLMLICRRVARRIARRVASSNCYENSK